MNIHQQIADLLEKGAVVYSNAAGRVGEILAVEDNELMYQVVICPRSRLSSYHAAHHKYCENGGHGVTTFLKGDKVKLVQVDADVWQVVNVWPDSSRLQLDKKRKHRAF